ncbi:thioredoxin family protein [Faecalibacter macacae]|uniref:Thioredoxin family protein n=1 Tax=Faecalibacter macacae TaxID=1859289 RepID=A0A3L9M820_9FLAO|nr:thioredoxin family protein [Faecalibacter macacae]RLZ09175.1 thioredoxin family protein [Faecalibacter macacae]
MTLLDYIKNGYSFEDYLENIEDQLEEQIELDDPKELVPYFAINLKQSREIRKNFRYNPGMEKKAKSYDADLKFLIISEGWCEDASQIVPIVDRLAETIGVECKFVFRDENIELMEEYNTNGSHSIPIVIGVTPEGEEAFRFGPRPAQAMIYTNRFKKDPDKYSREDFEEDLDRFYLENHGQDIISEILELIEDYTNSL